MKLIVGLGNPGVSYENTRHNVGFMIVDWYLDNTKWQEKFSGLLRMEMINGEKVIFLKPTTYMNLSGNSVQKVIHYYNISIQNILVIQDDMDLEFGKYKLKKNSSSGGHNGIKSIISCLGTDAFSRLKIGISHDFKQDTKDYVLGKFSQSELEELYDKRFLYNEIIDSFILYGIDITMNKYN